MNRSKLMILARKGLVEKEDVAIFNGAIKALQANKRLTLRQGQVLAGVLEILLNVMDINQTIYRQTLNEVRGNNEK
ncbi:MAG: hypothetical protein HOK95_06095 [Candidatus Marinimicrobia bacterium]|jgi:hypothetical protein|nr:hypothetical protein [Candidatus Neomarinimicrobiota bacterium]